MVYDRDRLGSDAACWAEGERWAAYEAARCARRDSGQGCDGGELTDIHQSPTEEIHPL
jgi:hypothetical protein